MDELSHTDERGKARMVDVGGKPPQQRMARAAGKIETSTLALSAIRRNQVKKGDVLTTAQLAGIQAAKRTAELIPLCHPLTLDWVDVRLELTDDGVTATSEVRSVGRTGVEMEALTAVVVALLTVYDMCKAVDPEMHISDVRLLEKVKHDVNEG